MARTWIAGPVAAVLGAAGAAGTVGAALLASPASAASARYAVTATGTGAQITVGGTALVAGGSLGSAASGSAVQARGSGTATPGATADEQATAASPGSAQTTGQVCAQPSNPFPAPLGSVVSFGAACGAASASQNGSGQPAASGSGRVASVSVGSPANLLPTQVTQGGTLAAKLQSVLGTLPSLPSAGLPLGTVLDKVAAASDSTLASLVTATLGGSTSTVVTDATGVSAAAEGTGGKVSLLAGLGGGGGALLTVTVGRSSASARVDAATGAATATSTAAAVTVVVDPPSGTSQTVSVAPGASQTFLAGTPLQTTVAAGAASETVASDKATSGAAGVEIDVAEGVGATNATGNNGGIQLQLGVTSAGAAGSPPVVAAVASTPPTTQPAPPASRPAPAVLTGATTVHTGEPWAGPLPIALLAASLLAVLGLLARRRLAPLVALAARAPGRDRLGPVPASSTSAEPGLRDLLRSPSGSGSGSAVSRTSGSTSTSGAAARSEPPTPPGADGTPLGSGAEDG